MADKAINILRYLPRISLQNIRRNPHTNMKKKPSDRGQHGGGRHGCPHKGPLQRMSYPRVGFEGRQMASYLKIPIEKGYYHNHHLKKQYPPLTLGRLQVMIDTGRIDPNEPIDINTLCSTNIYKLNIEERHFGVHLTDDGLDNFTAKVNIEVQHAKEQVIAAVERNGGVITSTFYDTHSLYALRNPYKFFSRGNPIPKRQLPNEFDMEYYLDPKNRGYLADPELIATERLKLAQKYGYELPDLSKDSLYQMLMLRKDPRQIFYGLRPGWLVNLKDKKIIEPLDPKIREFYELK